MKVKERATKTCMDCRKVIDKPPGRGGTGYAQCRDGVICYQCCAVRDSAEMTTTGKSNRVGLYLSKDARGKWHVGNWPSTLQFPLHANASPRKSWHNIARARYDVWFVGPDGFVWHGVQYGENTQIVHCARTQQRYTVAA